MQDGCKLSVVIPYYNKWARTRYLLQSLNRQKMGRDFFEVILVDNGSEEPLKTLLDGFAVNFSFEVVTTENRGRAAARNIGADRAKGEIILFVDDDIILPPDFLQSHYEIHQNRLDEVYVHGGIYDLVELTPYADPETGEYFPFLSRNTLAPLNSAILLSFEKVFEDWDDFSKKRRISRLEKLIFQVLSRQELSFLHWIGCVGGNLSLKRKAFEDSGGFDGNFKVWGGEDFELGYRLLQKGLAAVYNRDCFVYHITHAHTGHLEERRQSYGYFMEKHKDPCIPLLYRFLELEIDMNEFIERVIEVSK